MAVQTIIIKDSHIPELINVFGANWSDVVPNPDYDPQVQGSPVSIPNPQDKTQFALEEFNRSVRRHIYSVVLQHRKNIAPAIDTTDITEPNS